MMDREQKTQLLRTALRAATDALDQGVADGRINAQLAATVKEQFAFRELLFTESDRACALMASAYLDDLLERALRERLCGGRNIQDKWISTGRALGSFAARIDMAYMLGIIAKEAQVDLHLLKDIRNRFAHVALPMDFDHVDIQPICQKLVTHRALVKDIPRTRFTNTVSALVFHIAEARADLPKITAAAPMRAVDEDGGIVEGLASHLEASGWTDNPFAEAAAERKEKRAKKAKGPKHK